MDRRLNRRITSKRLTVAIGFVTLLLAAAHSFAVVEFHEFSSKQIQSRYESLIEELRCPKCQNQNLAGSDSAVAVDLRREVLIMLDDGYTDTEIRSFMRERYGDFILYNPPFEGKTLLVWVLPAVFLLFAALIAFFIIRNATRNAGLGLGDDVDPDAAIEHEPENKELDR